jgi:hypothetical protein
MVRNRFCFTLTDRAIPGPLRRDHGVPVPLGESGDDEPVVAYVPERVKRSEAESYSRIHCFLEHVSASSNASSLTKTACFASADLSMVNTAWASFAPLVRSCPPPRQQSTTPWIPSRMCFE